ncbi:DUF58 domain-containing protein [Candidatus Woesearchaeota archaeon]|nr:DUF58 domain-containing protein [Candidatus Woesearchaeota archaeon]
MIDISFLHQLDRLSLIINKRVTSNYAGERASVYTGQGLIFKDYAIYAPGEDFRKIDWKVFGRTDKLFIKRHEEERNLVIHIIVDYSGSMDFGSGKVTKAEYAGMLGIGFAYMAMKNNEKFVLSTFADELQLFRARRGKGQLAHIVKLLNERKPKGASKIELALARYKKLIQSRSFIVIISDFLYDPEEIRHAISRFKDHEVVLVQVLDKVEQELNIEGDYKLVDMESRGVLRTFISPFLRKNYGGMLADHQAKIRHGCSEIGAKFFTISTDTPIFDAFYKVLS